MPAGHTLEALARQARDARWPHEDYLHEVLTAEQASRHESVIRQRLREARFPEVKALDTFDHDRTYQPRWSVRALARPSRLTLTNELRGVSFSVVVATT